MSIEVLKSDSSDGPGFQISRYINFKLLTSRFNFYGVHLETGCESPRRYKYSILVIITNVYGNYYVII